MKGKSFSIILTVLALLVFTTAGLKAQHEGHTMPPAKTSKKKPASSKKKAATRSKARKSKATVTRSQTSKPAPQTNLPQDAHQHAAADTPSHSSMGAGGTSKMSEQSRHALAVTYAQSIGTFAKTLHDHVQSNHAVDSGFALGIVDEMKRSLDTIEQHHHESSAGSLTGTRPQMSALMQEMQTRVSTLKQNLTFLEQDLQSETPATSRILQRAEELIRLSGVPAGTTHQHGTGTTVDTERAPIKPTDQKDSMKEGAAVYVCPMHPEVTSGKPGKCPKCGMALVKKKGTE